MTFWYICKMICLIPWLVVGSMVGMWYTALEIGFAAGREAVENFAEAVYTRNKARKPTPEPEGRAE